MVMLKDCRRLYNLENAYILIFGTVGASRRVLLMITKFVKPKLTVNRTIARFQSKLNINQISLADAEKYLAEFDIVINTTPAGMAGNNKVLLIKNMFFQYFNK